MNIKIIIIIIIIIIKIIIIIIIIINKDYFDQFHQINFSTICLKFRCGKRKSLITEGKK